MAHTLDTVDGIAAYLADTSLDEEFTEPFRCDCGAVCRFVELLDGVRYEHGSGEAVRFWSWLEWEADDDAAELESFVNAVHEYEMREPGAGGT